MYIHRLDETTGPCQTISEKGKKFKEKILKIENSSLFKKFYRHGSSFLIPYFGSGKRDRGDQMSL
jgi:hypothetical protein